MLGFQGRHYCSDYLGVVSGDPFTRFHESMRLGCGKVEQFHAFLEQKSRNGDHISGGLGSSELAWVYALIADAEPVCSVTSDKSRSTRTTSQPRNRKIQHTMTLRMRWTLKTAMPNM